MLLLVVVELRLCAYVTVCHCMCWDYRFLDPDPPSLLTELGKTMGKKYHSLNKAITTLVSEVNGVTVSYSFQELPLNLLAYPPH